MNQIQVKSIMLGNWGQRVGIRVGDVISSYSGKPIQSLDGFMAAHATEPSGANLVVTRGEQQLTFITTREPLGFELSHLLDESGDHALWKNIIVTTTPSIDGYKVERVIDIVTSECVFGMNIFQDFLTALTDSFGGRSGISQEVLRDARKECLKELRKEAFDLGANAVIGIDLDYSEFSGQGKSMLFLVASGTAVVLNKVSELPVQPQTSPC